MLDAIITVEMTCDQACAVLAAIKCASLENIEWLKNHEEGTDQYQEVADMNHIMDDVTRNIVKQMQSVDMDPTEGLDSLDGE